MYRRQYVPVRAVFSNQGIMIPCVICWTDGEEYPIDRVKKISSGLTMKTGGQGDRYTVVIGGQERYLYFEHNPEPYIQPIGRWYVEVRDACPSVDYNGAYESR